MTPENNSPDPNNKEIANDDSGKKSEDTLDENTGADTELAIEASTDESGDKPQGHKGLDGDDAPSSNKGQGPAGENL